MYTYWRVLGMLAGREPAAENMVARFQQAVAGFRSLSQAVSKKKKVYFEAIHDKMKTFSPGAMPIFALETAGGINVAAEAQAVRGTNIAAFGKEHLLSLGMQIDVYLAQVGAMNRTSQEMIRSEPGFEMIKAVRQNRIYLIEEAVVSRPTLRLLEGIYIIGEVLYPDIFSASGRAILSRAGVQTDK
jgi:iron complex transport system substrate-binding protein